MTELSRGLAEGRPRGPGRPSMMRAIVVDQPGEAGAMRVREVGLPNPGPDELLVRVLAAGVGPWDVRLRRRGWDRPGPYVPGGEFAGVVVGETGAGYGFDDGAPVYGFPGLGGCYAEYVTCHVERLAPIPVGLRLTDAAAAPIDVLAADQGLTDILSVGAGDRILITAAAGGLGHFAVQIARAAGAIVVATASPRNHEFVHHLGAAIVVDHTDPAWPDRARDVMDGGAEQVLACAAPSLDGAARAARDGAAIATPVDAGTAGLPDADRVRWRRYDAQPSGSRLIRMAPRFDDGTLSVQVSARYYWQDAADAHRLVEQGHTRGKLVLIVDDDLAAALEV